MISLPAYSSSIGGMFNPCHSVADRQSNRLSYRGSTSRSLFRFWNSSFFLVPYFVITKSGHCFFFIICLALQYFLHSNLFDKHFAQPTGRRFKKDLDLKFSRGLFAVKQLFPLAMVNLNCIVDIPKQG